MVRSESAYRILLKLLKAIPGTTELLMQKNNRISSSRSFFFENYISSKKPYIGFSGNQIGIGCKTDLCILVSFEQINLYKSICCSEMESVPEK